MYFSRMKNGRLKACRFSEPTVKTLLWFCYDKEERSNQYLSKLFSAVINNAIEVFWFHVMLKN
jgi:hypothetical protein